MSFFVGFCSGIGAVVAASTVFGIVMLLKAAEADEDGLPWRAPTLA